LLALVDQLNLIAATSQPGETYHQLYRYSFQGATLHQLGLGIVITEIGYFMKMVSLNITVWTAFK